MLIDRAQATLQPAGQPVQDVTLTLPYKWDSLFPGLDGTANYKMVLPAVQSKDAYALYFPRLGNQAEIYINGQIVAQYGKLGDRSSDAAKAPLLIAIPEGLLKRDASATLSIKASMQGSRWGGLSAPYFGTQTVIEEMYKVRYFWRQLGTVGIVFLLLLLSAICFTLWRLHSDHFYVLVAIGALTGSLRYCDKLWESPPLGWPLWGGVMAAALASHLLLFGWSGLSLVGRFGKRESRWLYALLIVSGVMSILAFLVQIPLLWTCTIAAVTLCCWYCLCAVAKDAWINKNRESIALALGCILPFIAGIRDFFVVRVFGEGHSTFSYLPLATLFFVVFVMWLVIDRFTRQSRAYRQLLSTLEAKVSEREDEIKRTYEQLKQQSEQKAVLTERTRIMRDIHDGVGAQLVGLLNLLKKKKSSLPSQADLQDSEREHQQLLQSHVVSALDELRIAVDAMQPLPRDVVAVLADLRYRLAPRLEAAGITLDWQISNEHNLPKLSPQDNLHLQKMLLEIFTNSMKHAGATSISVKLRVTNASTVIIAISDNGCGIPSEKQPGHGLTNLADRARAIKAELTFSNNNATGIGTGTCVEITLPHSV